MGSSGTLLSVCYRTDEMVGYEGFVGLKARDLEAASRSQDRCAELLKRLARAPSPGLSPSLLMLFAKLASPSCRWLDGEAIAVELFAEEDATRVRVLAELGGGQRERVLPAISIQNAVLEELTEIAERTPSLLGSLRLERVSSRCVLLVASDDSPPMSCEFPISDSCLAQLDTDDDLDESWDRAPSPVSN